MKRLLLALLLVLMTAAPARAHGVNLTAQLGWRAPDTLTLRVLDVYQSPLEGLAVSAKPEAGGTLAMAETAPGLYTVRLPGTTRRVTVEFTAGGDLFRAVTSAGGAVDRPEEPVGMVQLERGTQSWFEPVLFGGAVLGLLSLLLVAMRRTKQAA